MVVSVNVDREDFPLNLDDLRLQNVVLYFAPARNASQHTVEVANLTLTRANTTFSGGAASTDDKGIISARRTGSNWNGSIIAQPDQRPYGMWELSLNYGDSLKDAAIRTRFKDGAFDDILLVLTYAGSGPTWPA
jgi:hypothetical protein